jgi:hypothetical protein
MGKKKNSFPKLFHGKPDEVVGVKGILCCHFFHSCRYIFLLDKFGRIRWQGFGLAMQEELSSLLSCTTLLLEEK